MTATTDAFDQILWLFRVDNPNTYTSLDDANFFRAIKELSLVQVKSPTNPYAGTATKVIRDLKRERRPKSFMDQLRKHMAATIIMAAGHRYPKNHAPKLHHWIPICYLGRFTRGLEQTKARGAHIPMIDFTAPKKHIITNDRAFAHVVKDKKGFFQLNSEYFFSIIEARYENAATRLTETSIPERSHLIAFASMLMVQHVRAPREGGFQDKDLHEFAGAIATLMDSIENGFPYVEFTEKAFPFTPEAPTRERRFGDGARAWHFPLSSKATFILSERELTKEERVRMTEGSRISTLKTAKRNGTPLYGALETDYPEDHAGL